MTVSVILIVLTFFLNTNNQPVEEWSPPILLSGDVAGLPSRPTIGVDSKNNVHIAWSQDRDANGVNDEVYYVDFRSEVWSHAKNVSNSSTPSSDPTIVCISDRVHLIWQEHLGLDMSPSRRKPPTSLYWMSWYNGKEYDPPEQIFHLSSVSNSGILRPSIASDSKGGLYVVFQTPADYQENDIAIMLKQRAENSWLPTRRLARGLMPALLADDDLQLHLVYISELRLPEMNTNNLIYSRSLDEGLTWQDSSIIHYSGLSPSYYPRVLEGKNSIVHVVWLKEREGEVFPHAVYHAFATKAGVWHGPFDVTQHPHVNFFNLSAAVDEDGVLHLAVEGSGKLYYSNFNGQGWLPLTPVFDRLGTYEPQIAVDKLGLLHIVWTERRLTPKGIYYSRKRIKLTE